MANWVVVMDAKGRVGITDQVSLLNVRLDGLFDGTYYFHTDKRADHHVVVPDLTDGYSSTFKEYIRKAEDGKGYQYVDCLVRMVREQCSSSPSLEFPYRFYASDKEVEVAIRYLRDEGFISRFRF